MKEKLALIAIFLIVSMIAMMIVPARAWEYYDTTVANPKTDNNVELFGPRADKLQINMYSDEQAEFTALETDQIDIPDCPVDAAHYATWTTDPLQQKIAVVNTGSRFGMYILNMRMDNRTVLDDGTPNPAYNGQNGNPMANVYLRRAIASIVDRAYTVSQIISGGGMPLLASALYTVLSPAYGSWVHPELIPTGALAEWCYVKSDGSANVSGGLAWLATGGYTYHSGGDYTTDATGYKFTIEFYYEVSKTDLRRVATEVVQHYLELAPPLGLGMKGNLVMHPVTSAGGRQSVMAEKKGHLYTGSWSLTIDPDHLYYLFAVPNYWHPGRPPNYMYYPGDADQYTVPSDGWTYTGFPSKYGWATSGLDFSDPVHIWRAGDVVWMNPHNYWSWEMMTATTEARAKLCALKSQEFMAWYVCGVPMWASNSFTAFHRTYTGAESPYTGQPWMGVVDQKGFGVWTGFSFGNMHTANAEVGNGAMTIRQGFRQPTMSLNPIYAEWVWDWYVLGEAYCGMIGANPYTLSNMQNLADNWEISTWDNSGSTCTKVTFHMRHDLFWSDGMPLTASDVKFSWGGPLVTGSISNLLEKKGYPPAYWSPSIADMLSVATPDPWTVICYLDVYSYFGLHSMSGFNIVLPEHIWAPYINSPPSGHSVIDSFDVPGVCSFAWVMDHTWDPTLHGNVITLSKNTGSYGQDPYNEQTGNLPRPIRIWTSETSNAREVYGNTQYIYPKSGDTTINLTVNVYLHNYYAYETGPTINDVYGDNNTMLDGEKNVTLWKWDSNLGGSGDPAHYVYVTTLANNAPWAAQRCTTEVETYTNITQPVGWYMVKVDINIDTLEYWNGAAWVPVSSGNNMFYNMKYTYREYVLATSRYDIGGANLKPLSGTAKYQPISDLKVDVKDLYACGKAYGTVPGYPAWNTACDVNNDLKVDVKDYYKIAQNYGWSA